MQLGSLLQTLSHHILCGYVGSSPQHLPALLRIPNPATQKMTHRHVTPSPGTRTPRVHIESRILLLFSLNNGTNCQTSSIVRAYGPQERTGTLTARLYYETVAKPCHDWNYKQTNVVRQNERERGDFKLRRTQTRRHGTIRRAPSGAIRAGGGGILTDPQQRQRFGSAGQYSGHQSQDVVGCRALVIKRCSRAMVKRQHMCIRIRTEGLGDLKVGTTLTASLVRSVARQTSAKEAPSANGLDAVKTNVVTRWGCAVRSREGALGAVDAPVCNCAGVGTAAVDDLASAAQECKGKTHAGANAVIGDSEGGLGMAA
ncbi:hypothetical protein BKA62DRAFT_673549 [Auriculariales sp. MPI-PUGE-AT-0066]|nr:hypothetical protein BKA62DRAFT_673549 [Auriculariales sp. MPI-PUGE-AT-0066]